MKMTGKKTCDTVPKGLIFVKLEFQKARKNRVVQKKI